MSAAIEIRNRVRFAAAQHAYDCAAEPDPEADEFADRRAAIEMAREELDRAVMHLNSGHLMLCDQAMADAAGFIV